MAAGLNGSRTHLTNDPMDFTLTPELTELQTRIKRFIADEVMPFEADPRQGVHGPSDALRAALIDKARQAGLLSPHAAPEYGGLGLSHIGRAVAFEEAGYSMLGDRKSVV